MKYIILLKAVAILFVVHSVAQSQQRQADSEAASESWKAYYLERASNDYQILWSSEETPLSLRPRAIVNWTNPLEQGEINGSTFLWENEGRPVVVGQLFSYLTNNDKRRFCHVFSTLTDEQVIARRNGEMFWKPALSTQTGWHVAKGVPIPSSNRPGRLLQMRGLARQFAAFTDEQSRGKRNLRLLPQPLYRSDATTEDFDCGLFAYVVGTDPELLILIECDLSQDSPNWRYRFAQSTRSTTVATFKSQEVYRYDSHGRDPQSPTAVYFSRHGVELIPGKFE